MASNWCSHVYYGSESDRKTNCLTQQRGCLRALLEFPHRLRGFGLHLDLLWFGVGGEIGACDLVLLCDIIVGLLVLQEGGPDVQRADVEDDSDGDVEKTQQYH